MADIDVIAVVEICDDGVVPTVRTFSNDKQGMKEAKEFFTNCLLEKEYLSMKEIKKSLKDKWYSTSNCYELYLVYSNND